MYLIEKSGRDFSVKMKHFLRFGLCLLVLIFPIFPVNERGITEVCKNGRLLQSLADFSEGGV